MTTTTETVPFATLLQHAAWARRLAAELVRAQDADDLVQDTWLAASRATGAAPAAPRQWLAAVMRNLARFGARSAWRRQRRETDAGAALHDGHAARPDEIAERLETQRLLADLVLALPAIHRDVVLLRFYDELPPRAIAARLGVPAGTVRSRLSLALRQLREQVRADERPQGGDWRRALVLLAGSRAVAGPGRAGAPSMAAAAAGGMALVGVAVVVAVMAAAGTARSGPHAGEPGLARPSAAVGRPGPTSGPPRLMSLPAAGPAADDRARLVARAEAAARYQVPLGAGPVRGAADARVTILEFVDYQCPFTAKAEAALARVLERHHDRVRFQVIQRPLSFHPQAAELARAAFAAAEQGRFWQLHAHLLGNTLVRWTPERLDQAARAAGLDVARFRRDLAGAAVRAHAEVDEATASSIRVEASPVFFVNGRLLSGADAPAHMSAVIEEELARADALAAAGAGDLYNAAIASGQSVLPDRPSPENAGRATPAAATAPASRGPRGFERLFTDGTNCGPLLDAPQALDFGAAAAAMCSPVGQRRPRPADSGPPKAFAWSLAVAGGERYQHRFGRDGSAVISSTTAQPDDHLSFQQAVVADAFRGQRVRFGAEVKGEALESFGGIWIRAIAADGSVLTSARAAAATSGAWSPATAELTIPARAQAVSFGFTLAGRGSLTVRGLTLDPVR